MRLVGRITDWNDEKGFGFVVPNGGGDRAFVHIKEVQRGSSRPVSGDLVSYAPVADQRGRLNAKQVRHAGQKIAVSRVPSTMPTAGLGIGALASGAGLAVFGVIPPLLFAGIAALSVFAYFMYWLDKSAAQRDAQRTPESTLHLVSLLGGWPGALIAQQQFRHKTIKQPFKSVFWGTVVLNVVALAWLVASGVAGELVQSLSR